MSEPIAESQPFVGNVLTLVFAPLPLCGFA